MATAEATHPRIVRYRPPVEREIPVDILADLDSVSRLLSYGEWKAAAIIGAAALEALLIAEIERRPWSEFAQQRQAAAVRRGEHTPWTKRPQYWGLDGLIIGARRLGLISAGSRRRCEYVRELRNEAAHGRRTAVTQTEAERVREAIVDLWA